MTDRARIAIAAIVTSLFLAAISTAGVLAHHSKPLAVSASARPAVTAVKAPAPSAPQVPYERGEGGQND
jgi:hypothetical protein